MAGGEISSLFIHRILQEEWDDLKDTQTKRIDKLNVVDTGHLRDQGRTFTVSGGSDWMAEATLEHPDYERFIDMKKLKFRSRMDNPGDRDRIFAHRGKPIHNSPIWGKFNTIAFRINWDLADEVLKGVEGVVPGMDVNIKVAL